MIDGNPIRTDGGEISGLKRFFLIVLVGDGDLDDGNEEMITVC